MRHQSDSILQHISAQQKLLSALVFGVATGLLASLSTKWQFALLAGWDAAALIYTFITWHIVRHMDGETTELHALGEDPSRKVADTLMLLAIVCSLVAVGTMLAATAGTHGSAALINIGFGVISIVVSWATLHTLFMLHYAEQYYTAPKGGVSFGDTQQPSYQDFAYLAFTVGMAFQVSDTAITTRRIRRTTLKHAVVSYIFGTFIVAATVNLLAGL